MIDDEMHPEWQAIELAIGQQCLGVFNQEGFNSQSQEIAQALCDSATKQARARGFDFPDMVVVCYKQSRAVRIYRRDATHEMKQRYTVRIIRDYPRILPFEIVDAIKQAWPDYSPGVEEKLADNKKD